MYFYLPYLIIAMIATIALIRGESLRSKLFRYQLGTGLALALVVRDLLSLVNLI